MENREERRPCDGKRNLFLFLTLSLRRSFLIFFSPSLLAVDCITTHPFIYNTRPPKNLREIHKGRKRALLRRQISFSRQKPTSLFPLSLPLSLSPLSLSISTSFHIGSLNHNRIEKSAKQRGRERERERERDLRASGGLCPTSLRFQYRPLAPRHRSCSRGSFATLLW